MTDTAGNAAVSATVHARTGIAGNPSDGYGGAVVSLPVPHFAATAVIADAPDPSELALIAATRARFGNETGISCAPLSIDTTIPRSVGLAGSSALVIASIQALSAHHDVALTPMQIATMAHAVEREDLHIAGGWQDQLIQRHGQPMLMEFGEPMRQRNLRPTALPMFVAWSAAASEASGDPHAELRSREEEMAPLVAEFAGLARRAADALEADDGHTVKECMGATFDLRTRVMPIAPAHRQMIEIARAHGTNANFSGSGGAVAGVVPKDPEPLRAAYAEANIEMVSWVPAERSAR